MCGGKGGNQVSQTQTYTPNPMTTAAIQSALGLGAGALSNFRTPVAPVAPFSNQQQQAFDITGQAQGAALPYLNTAAGYFTPQGASQFFNPMASNVMAGMQDIFGQQRSQMTGNLTQQAGGTGADRIAVGQAELAKQQGLAAGQTLSGLYTQANQIAQGAGFGMGTLGPAVQNSVLSGAQALLGTGGLQQQLQQAQMNAPYQNILASIMWPYQNAQFFGNMVGSLAPGLGGTTSGNTTYPQQSPWGTIAGLGLAGLGGYGLAGGFKGWGGGGGGGYNWDNPPPDGVNADTDPSLIGNTGGRVPYYADGGSTDDDVVGDHPDATQAELDRWHAAREPFVGPRQEVPAWKQVLSDLVNYGSMLTPVGRGPIARPTMGVSAPTVAPYKANSFPSAMEPWELSPFMQRTMNYTNDTAAASYTGKPISPYNQSRAQQFKNRYDTKVKRRRFTVVDGDLPPFADGGSTDDDREQAMIRNAEINELRADDANPYAPQGRSHLAGAPEVPTAPMIDNSQVTIGGMSSPIQIGSGQITPIKPVIPQLQQQQSSGGKGSGVSSVVSALGTAAKIGMMFANRGGAVPNGYALGGAPDPAGGGLGQIRLPADPAMPNYGGFGNENVTGVGNPSAPVFAPQLGGGAPMLGGGAPGPAMSSPSILPRLGGGDPSISGFGNENVTGVGNPHPMLPSSPHMGGGGNGFNLQMLLPWLMSRKGSGMGGMGGFGGGSPWSNMSGPMMGGASPWQNHRMFADGGEVGDDMPAAPDMPSLPDDPFERAALRVRGTRPAPGMYGFEKPYVQSGDQLAKSVSDIAPMMIGRTPAIAAYAADKFLPEPYKGMVEDSAMPGGATSTISQQLGSMLSRGEASGKPAEVDPEPKREAAHQAKVDDLNKKINGYKATIEGTKLRYANDKDEMGKRLQRPTADLTKAQGELNTLDGEFQKTHDAWATRNADRLRKAAEQAVDAATPFRTAHPDKAQAYREGFQYAGGILGSLAGVRAKGPLRAIGKSIVTGVPIGAAGSYLPDAIDLANEVPGAWERLGDLDYHKRVAGSGAMQDAIISGPGGLAGHELAHYGPRIAKYFSDIPEKVVSSFGRGAEAWRRYFGSGAAPASAAKSGLTEGRTVLHPSGEKITEWTDANGKAQWRWAKGTQNPGRLLKRNEWPTKAAGGAVSNPYAFGDDDPGGVVPYGDDGNTFSTDSGIFGGILKSQGPTKRPGFDEGPMAYDDTTLTPPAPREGEVLPPTEPTTGGHGSPGDGSWPLGGGSGSSNPFAGGSRGSSMMNSPWMALLSAGLGTLAASGQRDARGLPTPPLAAIGQGGLQGINTLKTQQDQALKEMSVNRQIAALNQQMRHQQETLDLARSKPIYGGTDENGNRILLKYNPATRDWERMGSAPGVPGAPGATPQAPPPLGGGVQLASLDTVGVLGQHAQIIAQGPYDYRTNAPYIEKGMEVPEPAGPIAGISVDALKNDAENYIETGKLPQISRGNNPMAGEQKKYQNAVRNYGTALARSRGLTSQEQVDQWRSAPGMLRFILGPDGRSTVALGTAVRHLDTVQQLAKAYGAGDVQTVNRLTALLGREFGNPNVTNLEAAGRIVGPEIIKAIGVAGAGTTEERNAAARAFGVATTPEQMLGAIQTTQKLLGGQLEGKKRQAAAAGVSEAKFKGLIGERPYEILSQAQKGEAAAAAGTPQVAAPQEGTIKRFKQGYGVFLNGKWQPYTPQGPQQ